MVATRLESTAKRADGTEFPAEFTITKGSIANQTLFIISVRDVTARQRAEEDITRLAAIVESARDAIYGVGLDGQILSWNRGAQLTYGYSADEILGRNVSILLPRENKKELELIAERLLIGQTMHDFATVRRAKNGKRVSVSLTISPILDSRRKIMGASVIAHDVTAQKAAEEALRRATESSVYASPVPIVAVDARGSITTWNAAAEDAFGWKEEEVVGNPSPIIPEDEQAATEALYQRVSSGETVQGVELRRKKRDGSLLTVNVSAAPLRNEKGEVTGIIKFLTDITKQKTTEGALRAAEEKYRGIFQNAIEGIYQATRDGRLLSLNPAFARMFGLDQGRRAGEQSVHPRLQEEFPKLLEEGATVRAFEGPIQRADGKTIWISGNVRAVLDPRGNVICFEGAVNDVTQQRELEQQMRQMQKIEALGRLAGGVAHDVNNILMAVSAFSELANNKIPAESPARSYLGEILKATERGASLTQSLLAFSRKQVSQPEIVDLDALIREQVGMLRRLIAENIELKFIPQGGAHRVVADPSQIAQVVMNLVVNARDAMPQGGELVIKTSRRWFDLPATGGVTATGHRVCATLTVADSGCGIDSETMSQIFDPFFTTKEQGKGTGLGLATVFGIVKQSGGHITVESEPGKGSSFTVYLPLAGEGAIAKRKERSARPRWGRETILLVEDEPTVRRSVQECLTGSGYTVILAANGAEGLAIAEAYHGPIHVLLTDLVMPEMSGIELAKRVTATRSETKVVLMSGYAQDVLAGEPSDPGYVLLRKPFLLEALGQCIRDLLDKNAAAVGAGG